MEEKKLSPQESMDLIAAMIKNTRQHLTKGEGNMLLFWGYLCVIVAILNELFFYLHLVKGMNFFISSKMVWWLIPVVGIPYTLIVKSRKAGLRNVMTYTDKLSMSLWNYVLWLAVCAMIIGALFFISGLNVWYVMELFSFFVVGMAVSVQGMIIKEKTMIFGGAFSVLSGGSLVAGMIVGNPCLGFYSVPLFILSYLLMMIIPGYILNYKASKKQ